MISKNRLKLIRSLQLKKYRLKYNKFICEGPKIILEALKQDRFLIEEIICTSKFEKENASSLEKVRNLLHVVDESGLSQVSFLETANDAIAVLHSAKAEKTLEEFPPVAFYLNAIRDPGNFGSILRIADWYGHPIIYCSSDCVDAFNSKVVQASMGSIFRVEVRIVEMIELKTEYTFKHYAADMDGVNLYERKLDFPALIEIGNEGQGLTMAEIQSADESIAIPGSSQTESLNAAVSAGILASHFDMGQKKW